ncbi:MAG: ATP-binding cassette domain-containing protein [Deltaproteobacteria bacterium]|nr:ATP-binding cassette domain-containing protein [Deltaproteobacteria bacterium]
MTALAAAGLVLRAGPRVFLDGAGLALAAGEVGALVGAAGCGKSLLVRALCGLYPSEGEVRVNGVSSRADGWEAVRARTGVLLGAPGLLDDLTVLDNVAWRLRRQRLPEDQVRTRVGGLLDEFGLGDAVGKIPAELSGGMQRRAALARALVSQPAVLILDDPTAGLDPVTTTGVVQLILGAARGRGAAVLWTTHDLAGVAARAHRVWVMRGGRLDALAGDAGGWAAELAA